MSYDARLGCVPTSLYISNYLTAYTQIAAAGCPEGSTIQPDGKCLCNTGTSPVATPSGNYCARITVNDHTKSLPGCQEGFGNPIYPLRGIKRELLKLGSGIAGVDIELVYDSTFYTARTAATALPFKPSSVLGETPLGETWSHPFHGFLQISESSRSAQAVLAGGVELNLRGPGDGTFASPDSPSVTVSLLDGRYALFRPREGRIDLFGTNGKLLAVRFIDGRRIDFTYWEYGGANSGKLIEATDQFGRKLGFSYDFFTILGTRTTRLSKLILPDQRVFTFSYGQGGISEVLGPDQFTDVMLYEDTRFPWALTGVKGRDGIRRSTFTYDADGRAIGSRREGFATGYSVAYANAPKIVVKDANRGSYIERTLEWSQAEGITLTRPNSTITEIGSLLANGAPRLTSQSQPAGSGCAASTSSTVRDTNGNPEVEDDFNGNRVCRVFDASRDLPTVTVAGLALTQRCDDVTTLSAALPIGARKTTTVWHPRWNLKARVAEPASRTTYVYNGQPDPTSAGNPIVNCIPANALALPDGTKLVVLCKQIEEATTDLDGSQGLAAQRDSNVSLRIRSWTYNQFGQVLTEKDPLNNQTTYEYYQSTLFSGTDPDAVGYTQGDLMKLTNAKGQVTQFTKYNKAGKLLEMKDSNNVVTSFVYDARQRLTSSTTAGQSTRYDYWPTGLLKQVKLDDGSFTFYEYNPAHQLRKVSDNFGNYIEYVIDDFGNRKVEETKDPTGRVARRVAREIDALGRVQQLTGRE